MRERVARAILAVAGWRMVGELPGPKAVLIGAPHTSNWDFFLSILGLWALEVDGNWVAKHTIFRGPAGWLLRRIGGIALDRGSTSNFVADVVAQFDAHDHFLLLLAPEGTRSRKDHWKSGFYWIAHGAGVPIVLGFLDYRTRTGGFGPAITPTGDADADMARLREFYADKVGRRPEQESDIRLRPAETASSGDSVRTRRPVHPA